ncbi:MAG TPA: substrate-binding domain-containing protein [Actinomycetota bacterium]|nr:substrate-binding domain-containing protein [Actinomycetota bacterium]
MAVVAAALMLLPLACQRGPADPDAEISIGVVIKGLDNPFFGAMRDGIEAKAEELGVAVQIQAAAGIGDTAGQVARLEAMAGRGYDCFVVNPISQTNLIQPLLPISQRGTPIVNIDSPLGEDAAGQAGLEIQTYIGTDNVAAGGQGALEMKNAIGSGQVALVGGITGDATSAARLDGFTAEADPELEIVQTAAGDWDRERALTVATDILRGNPDLQGFFAANDVMALGIVQALRNENRTDVTVIGVDGIEDALNAVEDGSLHATVSQYPFTIGEMGLEACVAAVQAGELPRNVDAPVQVVTSENVETALENFPRPVEEYDNPFAELIE